MGDLADILRATGSNTSTEDWQFQSTTMMSNCDTLDEFGNPFTHFKDPLIDNNNNVVSSNDEFNFHNNSSSSSIVEGFGKFGTVTYHEQRPNIFSRMLQINPDPKLQLIPRHNSPLATSTPVAAVTPPKVLNNNNNNMIFPNRCNGVQIPSPRNTAIKRRKSQAKKVVCIPAPAPANSRPSSGEIVPSDLWAWRKYGQKPIKGSPYPRGYYRCSSSKGCPARKQVERSRTDPNMLVITYTSEHNHPWPTQRNALAGFTRSQQAAIKNTSPTPKNVPILQAQDPLDSKQEKHKEKNELGPVKREMDNDHLEMDDPDFDDGYNPEMPDGLNQLPEDSFFADLGEIETDPLDLIFDSLGYDYWTGCNGGATTSAHYTPSFYGEDKRDS